MERLFKWKLNLLIPKDTPSFIVSDNTLTTQLNESRVPFQKRSRYRIYFQVLIKFF